MSAIDKEVEEFLDEAAAFDGERHPAFKFSAIGDTLKGVIVEQPRVMTHKDHFNPSQMKTSMVVAVKDDAEVTFALWVEARKPMATAIKEACDKVQVRGLAVGGTLAVRFIEEKDTGKGNPLKMFSAAYQPPVETTSVDDLLPG